MIKSVRRCPPIPHLSIRLKYNLARKHLEAEASVPLAGAWNRAAQPLLDSSWTSRPAPGPAGPRVARVGRARDPLSRRPAGPGPPGCCRRPPTGGRGPRPRSEPGSKRKGKRRRRSGRPRRPSEKGARPAGSDGAPRAHPAPSPGTPLGRPSLQASPAPRGGSGLGRWAERRARRSRRTEARRGRRAWRAWGPGGVCGRDPPATRLTCCSEARWGRRCDAAGTGRRPTWPRLLTRVPTGP